MATQRAVVWKFRFGATVIATDGEAGELTYVAVQPGQRAVTHAGVRLPGGAQVAVPLDRVSDADATAVRVTLTREGLLRALEPLTGAVTLFARATQVSVDSKQFGSLTQVSMTTTDATFRRIGVRRGLAGGEALLDSSTITDISDDGRAITCALQGGQPIPYRDDADLATAANNALYNYARLRVDLRAVQMRVIDGEIWLRGNVSSTLNRRVMTDLLENLSGRIATHNDLIADNELAVRIAQALAKDPATHGQLIGVYPNLGKVFLRGRATSPEAIQKAAQIAAGIPGQNAIVPQIAVSATAQFLPTLAPVTGTEDIIPGGD
jgi:osmotically-inducible protein OsmY